MRGGGVESVMNRRGVTVHLVARDDPDAPEQVDPERSPGGLCARACARVPLTFPCSHEPDTCFALSDNSISTQVRTVRAGWGTRAGKEAEGETSHAYERSLFLLYQFVLR